jgi:nucleotide-binding universal stress UspA family protein
MGVEDTPASQQAVRRFAALPLGAGSDVLLMSVINIIPAYHMEYTLHQQPALTSLIAHTQQSLAASADLLKGAAGRVETLVEEGVNGAEHLLARADAWKPDLIVVGSTGKAAWERVLLGSVSTRVLHHAPCSVWIERLQA